jgi:hypothetical protein
MAACKVGCSALPVLTYLKVRSAPVLEHQTFRLALTQISALPVVLRLKNSGTFCACNNNKLRKIPMRLPSLLAAAVLVSMSSVAFAEEAAPAATDANTFELSAEQDIALWCFGAFTVAADQYTTAGDTANAEASTKSADVLATKAAELLIADNLADEEFGRLGAEYTTTAYAQLVTKSEEPSYTVEQCNAVVAE